MPQIGDPAEIMTVGKAIVKGAEHVDIPIVHKTIGRIFGMNSLLTGDTGNQLKGLLKNFGQEKDLNYSLALKDQAAYKTNPKQFEAQSNAMGPKAPKWHQTLIQSKGQPVEPYILRGAANTEARNKVFEDHDQVIQAGLHAMAIEHGGVKGELKAKNIADALAVHFHDSVYEGTTPGDKTSRLYKNLKSPSSPVRDIDFDISPYKKQSDAERAAQKGITAALAYKAAGRHLTTPFNALIGRTFSSAAKASQYFLGSGYEGAKAEILARNGMGQIMLEEHQQQFEFEHGLIHKFAPGSAGEFVHRNMIIPGMTFMRRHTAVMLSKQGEIAAEELADRLKSPNLTTVQRARYDLKRLGINPDKVRYNGYKLDNNDIRAAMYNNMNDRMHINASLSRSIAATSTVTGRLFGTYHAYTSAQSNFVQQEIYASIQKRDPIGAIKNIAMLATVFPVMGSLVSYFTSIWAGEHIEDAREKALEGMGLVEGKRMTGLIQGYSDTAGLGMMDGFFRDLMHRKLLNFFVGAPVAALDEILEDMGAAGYGVLMGKDRAKSKYKARTYDPLIRDVIHYAPTMGILPNLAKHYKIAQKQQELNKEKPRTGKQLRAAAKAKARRDAKKRAGQ